MSVRLLKRRYSNGKTSLFLDIHYSGGRKKEALGLYLVKDRLHDREMLKLAEEIRARRELDMQAQLHGALYANKRKQDFVEYYQRLVQTKLSPHTRGSWENALDHLLEYRKPPILFASLDREFFEGFRTHLMNLVSANSAQIYFSRIKTALHQAVRDGIIQVNPVAFVTIKKQEHLPVYLTLDELRALSTTPCPNPHVRAAFLFACFSGLRDSDLRALTWGHVKGEDLTYTQQKTRAPEKAPLAQEAQEILRTVRTLTPSSRVKPADRPDLIFQLPRQSVVDKTLKSGVCGQALTNPSPCTKPGTRSPH
jgi:integrase